MRRGRMWRGNSARPARAAGAVAVWAIACVLPLSGALTGHAQLPCNPLIPCPTPTPTPPPTAPPSTPPPTAKPTAAANPTPTAAPSSGPAPAVAAGQPPPGAPAPATIGPSGAPPEAAKAPGAPSPPPTAAVAAARLAILGIVDDPVLAGQVSAIIEHPATADRPFLRHFLIKHASERAAGGGASVAARATSLVPYISGGGAALALVGAGLVLRRRRRRPEEAMSSPSAVPTAARSLMHRFVDLRAARLWTARLALVSLAAPVGVFLVTGVRAAGDLIQAARVPPVASARVPSVQTLFVTRLHAPASSASSTWARLVSIEQNLDTHQQELARQEARVATLTQRLGDPRAAAVPGSPGAAPGAAPATPTSTSPSPGVSSPTTTPMPPSPSPAPTALAAPSPGATADLARVVGDHQSALVAYQRALESEYQLFAAAAADPAQRVELLAAAASGPPEARAAVAFNLSVVESQLSQENAIKAAESLSQAQGPPPASKLLKAAGRPTLITPLGGALTLGFGPNDLPFEAPATHNGIFYPHFHTGLDIAAPLDTPVHAAADGRVILATASVDEQGRLVGYGNYVAIAHAGGLTTVYGHLDTIAVKPGQTVHQGDAIGLEGSTGNSTGPHVHFETRLSGGIVDPQPYLSGQIRK
ncbi:MAG: M23 family metallopeptidase [Candidatus Dormibacteria bacterium]